MECFEADESDDGGLSDGADFDFDFEEEEEDGMDGGGAVLAADAFDVDDEDAAASGGDVDMFTAPEAEAEAPPPTVAVGSFFGDAPPPVVGDANARARALVLGVVRGTAPEARVGVADVETLMGTPSARADPIMPLRRAPRPPWLDLGGEAGTVDSEGVVTAPPPAFDPSVSTAPPPRPALVLPAPAAAAVAFEGVPASVIDMYTTMYPGAMAATADVLTEVGTVRSTPMTAVVRQLLAVPALQATLQCPTGPIRGTRESFAAVSKTSHAKDETALLVTPHDIEVRGGHSMRSAACCFDDACCAVWQDGIAHIPGSPEGGFKLQAFMYREEVEAFTAHGRLPLVRRPCVLCVRLLAFVMRQDMALRGAALSENVTLLMHGNAVGPGEYRREVCMFPATDEEPWTGLVRPMVLPLLSMLRAYRTSWGGWGVDQSALIDTSPSYITRALGGTAGAVAHSVALQQHTKEIRAVRGRAPLSALAPASHAVPAAVVSGHGHGVPPGWDPALVASLGLGDLGGGRGEGERDDDMHDESDRFEGEDGDYAGCETDF